MSVFIDACRRKATPFTPIWLMRQAGRYQKEYRAIREKVSFVELCRSPDLAAEVTVLPITQLGVDAAIIFADILLILEPLGIGFEFTKDDGPRIPTPIRTPTQIDAVRDGIDAKNSLGYVMESIRRTKAALPSGVPLIGFAGAPFTLASYAIEGGGSKTYEETKRLMFSDRGAWDALMARLTVAVADYLNAQIQAGADAVQVFDSWVGCLGPEEYRTFVAPHMRRLFDQLDPSVPHIHFGTGNPMLYPEMKGAGGDVLGIDWRTDLGTAWSAVGGDVAIQGNLDPAYLLVPEPIMKEAADAVLRSAGGREGHIFNLGHGVMPRATVDQVRALVDHVHETSQR